MLPLPNNATITNRLRDPPSPEADAAALLQPPARSIISPSRARTNSCTFRPAGRPAADRGAAAVRPGDGAAPQRHVPGGPARIPLRRRARQSERVCGGAPGVPAAQRHARGPGGALRAGRAAEARPAAAGAVAVRGHGAPGRRRRVDHQARAPIPSPRACASGVVANALFDHSLTV